MMKIFLIFNIIRYALCINVTFVSPKPTINITKNSQNNSINKWPSPTSSSNISKLHASCTFSPSPSSSNISKLHASYTFSPSPFPTPKKYNITKVIASPIVKKEVFASTSKKEEIKEIKEFKEINNEAKNKVNIIMIFGLLLIIFFIIYLSIKILFFRSTLYNQKKKNDDRLPIYSPKSSSQNNSPNGYTQYGFIPNHEMKLYKRNNSSTNLLSTNLDDKI